VADRPWSLALRDISDPDFADAAIVPLPPGATTDPRVWAEEMFRLRTLPAWVAAALAVRQAVVPLLGIRRAPRDTFAIREQVGDEVLIAADDTHLDFRCAVAVDRSARLVRVTTTVRLHGWRGRVYFAPVRLLHPVVVQAMIRKAGARLAAGT
jgi:uncharacterized protein DUF2867